MSWGSKKQNFVQKEEQFVMNSSHLNCGVLLTICGPTGIGFRKVGKKQLPKNKLVRLLTALNLLICFFLAFLPGGTQRNLKAFC